MRDICVIVGMDWKSQFGAMIDYERQMVTIRDPSRGVLTVYSDGTRSGLAFYIMGSSNPFCQERGWFTPAVY